jgi:hypothetical protein
MQCKTSNRESGGSKTEMRNEYKEPFREELGSRLT